MKNKNFLIITFITILLVLIVGMFKFFHINKYGYLLNVKKFSYPARYIVDSGIVNLQNGILKIGSHKFIAFSDPKRKEKVKFEFLDYETNKINQLEFLDEFIFLQNGILIDDNKLLLTHVLKDELSVYKKQTFDGSVLYDSLAIVNLKTMKTEKIIKREPKNIENKYPKNLKFKDKIFILDRQNCLVEIFDIKSYKLKTIDLSKFALEEAELLSNNQDRIFIVKAKDKLDGDESFDSIILEYNSRNQTFNEYGKTIFLNTYTTVKMQDNNIVYLIPYKKKKAKIQVFDVDKLTLKTININCRNENGSADFEFLDDKKILIVEGWENKEFPLICKSFINLLNGVVEFFSQKNMYILDLETGKIIEFDKFFGFGFSTKIIKANNKNFYILSKNFKLLKLWED